MTLLAVMAAVFSPSPSRPAPSAGPRPAQTWEAHHARALTDLARDIAAAQKAITSGPNRARGGPAPAVARLGADLARLRSQPEPPDPALGRAWDSALSDASAAVGLLARDTPVAPSRTAATARSDLEAAGESVVAVIQAARSPRVAYPH